MYRKLTLYVGFDVPGEVYCVSIIECLILPYVHLPIILKGWGV